MQGSWDTGEVGGEARSRLGLMEKRRFGFEKIDIRNYTDPAGDP